MNDTEFLELLNLYLDHEISAADAARLEAEVQANPDRRRVYQDYCRMQKACTVLAKDFAEQPAEPKVISFEPRRSTWTTGLYAVGGLAAAACVALVFLNRTSTAVPDVAATPVAVATTMAPASNLVVPPTVVSTSATQVAHMVTAVPEHRSETRAMLASMPLALVTQGSVNTGASMAAAQPNGQAQFEWMHDVQLAPIQHLPLEEVRLDARSPLQPASRTYAKGRTADGAVEMTAFKFDR